MKKSNKLTAAVTASVVASTLVAPAAFASATEFSDIANSYAQDAINELVEAGILNGVGEGKFNPTGKITRQDFAIILAKAAGLDTTDAPATATFSDVPTTHYSYNYVEAAVKAELIAGLGEGTFGLGQNLTREQMAVLFVRALGVDATGYGDKLEFSDAGKISAWAKDAVGYAVEIGLMNGAGNNTFNPQGLAERQQVALVASNFLKADPAKQVEAKLASVSVTSDTEIALSFDKAVKELAATDVTVAVKGTSTPVAVESVALSEDKKSATAKVAKLAAGTTFAVTYKGATVDFTTEAAKELKVESVTALNLKQIKVTFNQELDADTAEAAANYTFGGVNGATAFDATNPVELQADGKSVVITLAAAEAQQASKALVIKDVKNAAALKIAEVSNDVNFFDATVPSVVSASVTGPNTVDVVFSEPVTAAAFSQTSFSLDNNTYSLSNAATVAGQPNKVTLTLGATLPEGEHTIKINPTGTAAANQIKDFAGFVAPTSDVKFSYVADKNAPVATIDTVAQNQVVIKFDKAITNTGAISVYHTYNNVANYVGTQVWSNGNKTLTVSFGATPIGVGAAKIYINNATTGSAADAWGNKFASIALDATVTADTTAPTVASVKQIDSNNIDVEFSEAVVGANSAINYVLKDASGTVVNVLSAIKQGTTNVYRLNTNTLQGGNYTLSIAADLVKDASFNSNKMAAFTTTVAIADKIAPTVAGAVVSSDLKKVQINFSEAMTDAVLNAGNYLIAFNGTTKQALPEGTTVAWGSNNKSVILTFPSAQANIVAATTKVFVAQVADLAGNKTVNFENDVVLASDNITAANIVADSVKAISRDTIQFQLNTQLTAINVANFSINNVAATAASYVNNDGKATVTVKTGTKFGTDLAGLNATAISIAANGLTSGFGTKNTGAVTIANVAVTDLVAPEFAAADAVVTNDTDGNGKIDTVTVTFSEALYVASVQETDFTVEGYTVTGLNVVGGVVTLNVKEQSVVDTDAAPKVTLVGAVSDASAQRNSFGEQAAKTAADKAKAVITSAAYKLDNGVHKLIITLSEGVNDGPTAAALLATDFAVSGGVNITAIAHTANTKVVELTLDAAPVAGATVEAVAASVYDVAGNAASTVAKAITL